MQHHTMLSATVKIYYMSNAIDYLNFQPCFVGEFVVINLFPEVQEIKFPYDRSYLWLCY